MDFNFFLWPMLFPMVIVFLYCMRYKRESIVEIAAILLAMICIVILYWPLSNLLYTSQNILVKCFLFVLLPIFILLVVTRKKLVCDLKQFGITKEGLRKSVWLSILFVPSMLGVTFLVKYYGGVTFDADMMGGIISFLESFTEEFFFRGILFIFLLSRTNLKIAYITSLASFILMHPQHLQSYSNLFFISTIVQGMLTLEIVRRSNNITGSWLLHGINRFFGLVIIPLILVN